MFPGEARREARYDRQGGRDRGDAQMPRQPALEPVEILPHRPGVADNAPRPVEHPLALGGETAEPRGAIDEAGAERIFERLQPGRERRLADAAGLGSAPEVAFAGEGQQELELVDHGVRAASPSCGGSAIIGRAKDQRFDGNGQPPPSCRAEAFGIAPVGAASGDVLRAAVEALRRSRNSPMVSRPARWPEALSSRGLRLWSGSILGLYLLSHFINIALGLVSVGAMQAAAPGLAAPWRSLPGTVLLGGAFLVHFGLSLRALHRRRTLRMGAREAAQLGLGLALPLLLASHVVGARIEPALTGTVSSFADQVDALWIRNPLGGARQMLALVVAWAHGCVGFWFALRGRPWFARSTWLLYGLALLIPILALLGFAEAGRDVVDFPAVAATVTRPPPGPISADDLHLMLVFAFVGAIALVLAARGLRGWRGRHRRVRVSYPDGQSVSVPARLQRARGEPRRRHPACLGLRRPRTLFDVPGPDPGGAGPAARGACP